MKYEYPDPLGKARIVAIHQATYAPSYSELQKATEETWQTFAKEEEGIVGLLNYYGGIVDGKKVDPRVEERVPVLLSENTLSTGLEDLVDRSRGVDTRLERMFITFEYCLDNYEFDYIIRTGGTVYVIFSAICEILNRLPRRGVYNGARNMIGVYKNNEWKKHDFYFVNGYNAIFSKDIVIKLVKNKKKLLEHNVATIHGEDVAIGYFLTKVLKLVDRYGLDQYPFIASGRFDLDTYGKKIIMKDHLVGSYGFKFSPLSKTPQAFYDLYEQHKEGGNILASNLNVPLGFV